MATLPNGTYANPDTPLWATANAPNSNLTTNAVTLTGTPPLVLTNDGGVLKQNGFSDILTSLWSTTPATSNKIFMDTSNILSNVGSNLYFAGTLLADAGAVPNIGDWALYPQLSNINGNSFSISNSSGYSGTGIITTTSNISASGNVSGATGTFPTLGTSQINGTGTLGALGITSTNQITVSNTRLSNTSSVDSRFIVDSFTNLGNTADFVVEAKRGNRGRILMTADGGYSNGAYGEINLTANGGVTPGSPTFATGGLINITANTPVATSNTSTSAIKLSSSSILSYAGSISPTFSTAGYQYIYGQAGINIVCSATPPVVPSLPLSIYMYSAQGTRISNGIQTDIIQNISSGDKLELRANGIGSGVVISNLDRIEGNIILGSNAGVISQMSNITTSNINLSTINNAVYTPLTSWSTLPATTNVNLSNFSISNAQGLSSSTGLTIAGQGVAVNSTGNNNISLTASGTGDIQLNAGASGEIDMTSPVIQAQSVSRVLSTSNVAQPIFQYGQINSSGNSGNQLVFLSTPYSSSGTYSMQVSMADSSPAQMSVANISANSFRIYWANAGVGTHNINWLAYGV